ncbi:cobalamin biosynthesis protein CobW [Merismopedia glauca]|uniref:Cobalamin biosynthesis protein CobW n=1 Tax=Merismopedia glauca CCAP 1448/3 TaxID=1296344 RepID=A0A2T1BZH9_9CYAN|nr:cobalamin biosynthesis protein CobW [Merismopedia glauca]PSB01430.1 cobalamin biosynthesis protein CobW [Merismopedia glauca CCAP 1448/3]
MASKLPVTVITGFLGSGKTTLIRHLLQNNQGRRIAVIVNEFGELGIDGELLRSCGYCPEDEANSNIVELTNGCLCCTVQEEFLPTMQQLLQRRDAIDSILIETSGLALPKPLVKAFRWPEIRHAATVDAVITVVDCEAVANGRFASDPEAVAQQRQEDPNLEHETPLQELFEDQLACADLVILTKQDLVTPQQEAEVRELVDQELPREVKIVAVSGDRSGITPALLLGLGAAVEDNLDARPSHHDTEEDHDHDDEINSTHLILDRAFKPEILQQELAALVESQEIYRIKGFVAVPNKSMRLVIQGVGKRFEQFYDRPWKPDEIRQTRLVFIGRDLDEQAIAQKLVETYH